MCTKSFFRFQGIAHLTNKIKNRQQNPSTYRDENTGFKEKQVAAVVCIPKKTVLSVDCTIYFCNYYIQFQIITFTRLAEEKREDNHILH